MAGYSEDGTKVVQKGGSWFQLEFHENDTIADFQDRTLSCTGYYLIDGSLLENPVYMYAETEFTLDEASKYDKMIMRYRMTAVMEMTVLMARPCQERMRSRSRKTRSQV